MSNNDKLKRPTLFEKYNNGQIVGQVRYQLLHDTISHCRDAINKGFYLEAISMLDSLIGDRMESLLYELTTRKREANTALGYLWDKFEKPDNNGVIALDCIWQYQILHTLLDNNSKKIDNIPNVKGWAEMRNRAVHGFAKLTPISNKSTVPDTFCSKRDKAKEAAEAGWNLFCLLNKEITAYRKNSYVSRERTIINGKVQPIKIVNNKGMRIKVRDGNNNKRFDKFLTASELQGKTQIAFSISKQGQISVDLK